MVLWESHGSKSDKKPQLINRYIANQSIQFGKKILYVEAEQKLFTVTIDKDLNFQNYTKSIIKTSNQKLSAFFRVSPFITDFKEVIFNSFIKGRFN